MIGADLRGAFAGNALFVGADLSNARLEEASLQATDLRNADLSAANLQATDLRSANLIDAKGLSSIPNAEAANIADAEMSDKDKKLLLSKGAVQKPTPHSGEKSRKRKSHFGRFTSMISQ